MTANLPVSPILRRELSPVGIDSVAEDGLKSPSPKPKFAPRASSPALPAAAVHPGGPLRTGSILKKPVTSVEGSGVAGAGGVGFNWFGEGDPNGQAIRPLSPPLASHAPGLGLGEAIPSPSPYSALSPPQSASLQPQGSPITGTWSFNHQVASAAVSDSGQSTPAGSVQGSRATSPHCHFAPLPKVDGDRPGTRRNSFAQGVRSKILALNGDLSDEPSALETDDALNHEFTKLSTGPPPPPTERGGDRYPRTRRSSSGRSTSPSPSRRSASALSGAPSVASSSAPTSRSHSPAMSRHASGDALHLHFIQAPPPKTARSMSQTRDAGSAGEALPVLELAHRGKQERRDSSSALAVQSPVSPGRSAVASPTLAQQQHHEVTPLHSAATAVAPMPARRMTSFVEPSVEELQRDRSPSVVNRCKPTNQDIVALDPLAGAEAKDDELEEVEEEDEDEEEEDNATEGEDGEGERSEEEDEDDGEEDDDDEDEDEDEDEGDSEAEKMRKTAISGGVEVVHWRKEPDEE